MDYGTKTPIDGPITLVDRNEYDLSALSAVLVQSPVDTALYY